MSILRRGFPGFTFGTLFALATVCFSGPASAAALPMLGPDEQEAEQEDLGPAEEAGPAREIIPFRC